MVLFLLDKYFEVDFIAYRLDGELAAFYETAKQFSKLVAPFSSPPAALESSWCRTRTTDRCAQSPHLLFSSERASHDNLTCLFLAHIDAEYFFTCLFIYMYFVTCLFKIFYQVIYIHKV